MLKALLKIFSNISRKLIGSNTKIATEGVTGGH